MNYFTADTHFNHENIIKYCKRPFDSVEDMNRTIINNWNSIVYSTDIVYHLGDFGFGNVKDIFNKLRGVKVLIPGSHDGESNLFMNSPIMELYPGIKDEYGNMRLIVLSHYAMRVWPKSHYASWHLYGHSHGQLPPYGLSFDVGIDTNNFYPYSLDQIAEKMKTLIPIHDYRS